MSSGCHVHFYDISCSLVLFSFHVIFMFIACISCSFHVNFISLSSLSCHVMFISFISCSCHFMFISCNCVFISFYFHVHFIECSFNFMFISFHLHVLHFHVHLDAVHFISFYFISYFICHVLFNLRLMFMLISFSCSFYDHYSFQFKSCSFHLIFISYVTLMFGFM